MLEFRMDFEIIGEIKHSETIARGSSIRELNRLRKIHGPGNFGVNVKVMPQCACLMVQLVSLKFTGTRLQVLVSVNSKSNGTWT